MDVKVTARHAGFSGILKEYAAVKAERLAHYFEGLRKVEVILDREGQTGASAELIASAVRGKLLVCRATGPSAMAAVDAAADRMERRLTKFKERLRRKHPSHEARTAKFNEPGSELAAGEAAHKLWW